MGIALAATIAGLGMALVQYWLFGLGVVIILITVGGLLFEYSVGNRVPLR
ncbi:MAG: aa3-type cytochrome oxidase subunit IV [Jatrophihabitans sp.]